MRRSNQYERTDRDITNALLTVMDHKPFEKITVQDILDEAMINRSTFYQHFPDKYAILEQIQDKYVNGLTERFEAVWNAGNCDLADINEIFYDYLKRHQYKMRKLMQVKSETLDLTGRMVELFDRTFSSSGSKLTRLERRMLSAMIVTFFSYSIQENIEQETLGDTLIEVWTHMTAYFFRIADKPDVEERLMKAVSNIYHDV